MLLVRKCNFSFEYGRGFFSGMDLSHIYIPEANLKGAILDHTNLSHTNLSKVVLQNAFCPMPTFTKSQMQQIFG